MVRMIRLLLLFIPYLKTCVDGRFCFLVLVLKYCRDENAQTGGQVIHTPAHIFKCLSMSRVASRHGIRKKILDALCCKALCHEWELGGNTEMTCLTMYCYIYSLKMCG